MDHLKAIAIKFISTLALLYVILGMVYQMSFGNVLLITLVLSIASYVIGDLMILPRTNNTISTAADFGLSLIIIWMMSAALVDGYNLFSMSLVASIAVTIFEYFFHKYMASNVYGEENDSDIAQPRAFQYQTEASEELSDLEFVDEEYGQGEQPSVTDSNEPIDVDPDLKK